MAVIVAILVMPNFASAIPDVETRYDLITNPRLLSTDQFDLSDDGSRCLACQSYNEWLGVFSIETNQLIWSVDEEGGGSYDHQFDMSGDGKYVISGDRFGMVNYYSIEQGMTPVWSFNISDPIYSVSISKHGDKAVVGYNGGVCYFDSEGLVSVYMSASAYAFRAVVANDGGRFLAISQSDLAIFNSDFNLTKVKEIDLPSIANEVHISDDGLTGAIELQGGTFMFLKFYDTNYNNPGIYQHSFGGDNADIDLSRDGSTALVRTDEGIYVYDVDLSTVRWSIPIDSEYFNGEISPDGSYAAIYSGFPGQLYLYDGQNGELLQKADFYEVWGVDISADGKTIAVLQFGISVYRPTIEMSSGSVEWAVSSDDEGGFWLDLSVDGQPVEGAWVDVTIDDFEGDVTVDEVGDGRYQVNIGPSGYSETMLFNWHAVCTKSGFNNGSASGTLKVIGTDDKQNTIVQLEDMNSRIGTLQLIVFASLAATIVMGLLVVVLLMRRKTT